MTLRDKRLRIKVKKITLYQVFNRMGGRPVNPPPDMLRYDWAYASDKYPTLVAIIDKDGYHEGPTMGRWDSFVLRLKELGTISKLDDSWYTYDHHPEHQGLKKIPISEVKVGPDREAYYDWGTIQKATYYSMTDLLEGVVVVKSDYDYVDRFGGTCRCRFCQPGEKGGEV